MSTRLGRPKQLIRIGDHFLLERVAKIAAASGLGRVVVVLGHNSENIISTLGARLHHPKIKTVLNPHYKDGMSTSLQFGLRQVKDEFPAIMVLLGDQPFIDTATIDTLIERFDNSGRAICVPTYRGNRGLPVCMGREFYPDILRIEGDMGAREIIKNNPLQVLEVEIDNPHCFFDIDVQDDLNHHLLAT